MTNRVRFGVVALVSVLAACGSSSDEAGDEKSPSAGESSNGGPASSSGGSAVDTELAGVWGVTGADDRGAYRGHVELVPDGRGYRFTRVIRYDDVRPVRTLSQMLTFGFRLTRPTERR